MKSAGLALRRHQLELLGRACAARTPARIQVRAAARAANAEPTALLALRDDGLLLAWPPGAATEATAEGAHVVVSFALDGRSYRLHTRARGRTGFEGPPSTGALRVELPLRLTAAPRGRTPRLRFDAQVMPWGTLTPVIDRERRFAVRIAELSASRGRAESAGIPPELLSAGTHHWLDLDLPGEARPAGWIVRLVHVGGRYAYRDGGRLGLSFAVCGGDDGTASIAALERVAGWYARQGRQIEREAPEAVATEGARC